MFISYKTKFNDKNFVLFLRDEALNLTLSELQAAGSRL